MSVINFANVSVNFEETKVLNNVSLTLHEQRIGIIGANGSGKSTLLRLINGLGEPTTGSVTVDDIDVATNGKAIRKKVGFIFSDAENQIVMPTVRDDVNFSLKRFSFSRAEREERVNTFLERFHLAELADQSPHTLSGGQKQMLALAAVLVTDPAVVLADEPTALLDLINRNKIREECGRLEQQLIVVTHDLDFVTDFDRVICIDSNTVAFDGAPADTISFYTDLMARRAL